MLKLPQGGGSAGAELLGGDGAQRDEDGEEEELLQHGGEPSDGGPRPVTWAGMHPDKLGERVRAICLALPGVTERRSHGAPAFFARRQFVQLWPEGHHEHQFPHLWCASS